MPEHIPHIPLDPAKFSRVASDRRDDAGYFCCCHLLSFAPGKYECDIEATFGGWLSLAQAEAVAWNGHESSVLARAPWVAQWPARKPRAAKLKFSVAQPSRIEFRGYARRGFGTATLVGCRVRRVDGSTLGSVSENLFPWPVQRLQWVVIGTTSICNASCPSCPTNKSITSHLPKKHMEWPLFVKVIDGIADCGIDIAGHISFGLFGDSLVDPFAVRRAEYVKMRLPQVRLVATTNGAAATDELASDLGKYVDEFSIHVEAIDPKLYKRLMQPLTAARVFPRIERFIRLCGKPVTITCPIGKHNVDEFPRLNEYWLARGAVRVHPLTLNGRCTDQLNFADLALAAEPGRCRGNIVSNLIVDADGAVLSCCEDFQKRQVIGNLALQTVTETLQSQERKALHDELEGGRWSELPACRTCLLGNEAAMYAAIARCH